MKFQKYMIAGLFACSVQHSVFSQTNPSSPFQFKSKTSTVAAAMAYITSKMPVGFGRISQLQGRVYDNDGDTYIYVLGTVDIDYLQQRKVLCRFGEDGSIDNTFGQQLPGSDEKAGYWVLPESKVPAGQTYYDIQLVQDAQNDDGVGKKWTGINHAYDVLIKQDSDGGLVIAQRDLGQEQVAVAEHDRAGATGIAGSVYGATCNYDDTLDENGAVRDQVTFQVFKQAYNTDGTVDSDSGIAAMTLQDSNTADITGLPHIMGVNNANFGAGNVKYMSVIGYAQSDATNVPDVFDTLFVSLVQADDFSQNIFNASYDMTAKLSTILGGETVQSGVVQDFGTSADGATQMGCGYVIDSNGEKRMIGSSGALADILAGSGDPTFFQLAAPGALSNAVPAVSAINPGQHDGNSFVISPAFYVAGTSQSESGVQTADRVWVAAYASADGSLDTSFNSNNEYVEIDLGMTDLSCDQIMVSADAASLWVLGHGINTQGFSQLFVVKMSAGGELDTDFGVAESD